MPRHLNFMVKYDNTSAFYSVAIYSSFHGLIKLAEMYLLLDTCKCFGRARAYGR